MKTLLVNPEYSLYAVGGNDYNPRHLWLLQQATGRTIRNDR